MGSDQQIIVDSDAFIGLMHRTDAHHRQATAIYTQLKKINAQLTTTSAVISEVITLLSHRQGQQQARSFLEDFIDSGQVPIIFVSEALYTEGLALFRKQTKKGTSFTDCVNAAVCNQLELSTIFSFDKGYPSCFGIHLVSKTV